MKRLDATTHDTDDSDEHDPLAQRLRAGARSAAPAPSPALHGRILSALRATPRIPLAETRRVRWLADALAAAAVLLVLLSAWFLTRPAPARRTVTMADLTHGLLGAPARVLALPGQAEADLRLEVARLLSDTSRLAERVTRGLPATLRAPEREQL